VPFENSFYFNTGEDKETTYSLLFQPVIPVDIGGGINWISRPIVPLILRARRGHSAFPRSAAGRR
jgi:hypothetical protein